MISKNAKRDLEFVLSHNIKNEFIYQYLGCFYRRQNNYSEAIKYFTFQLGKDPGDHITYYNRAITYMDAKQWQKP